MLNAIKDDVQSWSVDADKDDMSWCWSAASNKSSSKKMC